ncbi:MAG: homoserine kinase [Oscillospiraceae bacterium]
MINIQIPATSANLGAGFDALGLALNYYNYVGMEEFDTTDIASLDGGEIPTDESNLIYDSAKTLFNICGRPFKSLKIRQINNIPMTRGLGSSSACIIAGLFGANTLMGEPLSLDDLVNLSAQIEGHPDNTAPALLGGIVTAVYDGKIVHWVKQEVHTSLKFVVVIPDFELKTERARACLPSEVSHKDAVYNLSRAALFSASLLTGKYQNLRTAVHDKLHQPYRMELIPHARDVFDLAYSNNAYAAYISGAGPSIMAIVDNDNEFFCGKMRFALDNMGLNNWKIKELCIDNIGTKLIAGLENV